MRLGMQQWLGKETKKLKLRSLQKLNSSSNGESMMKGVSVIEVISTDKLSNSIDLAIKSLQAFYKDQLGSSNYSSNGSGKS